jgi:5-methylcytosine-specific restriction endonuclease McrA
LLAVIEQPQPDQDSLFVHDILVDCRNQLYHTGRFVKKKILRVDVQETQTRSHAGKMDAKVRAERFVLDGYLCLVCKMRATEAHHITYERFGCEKVEDLRSLCDRCHNAVTMLEYTLGMYDERIDPLDTKWHRQIREVRCQL